MIRRYESYIFIHRKNGFAEVSKNLARYKSENNFVELLSFIYWTIKIIM